MSRAKKTNRNSNDIRKKLNTAILICLLILIILLLLRECGVIGGKSPSVIGGGEPIPEEQSKEKDTGNIHLPAYAGLTFAAGTKTQEAVLYNPGENTCLIRISLILADGTTIYRSELVKPGYYTKPITLVAPMERGIYRNVMLKYECFTDDEEQTPLNGATCKLDTTVK